MKTKIQNKLIVNSLGKNFVKEIPTVYSVQPEARDHELLKVAISEAKQLTLKNTLIFWRGIVNKWYKISFFYKNKNCTTIIKI